MKSKLYPKPKNRSESLSLSHRKKYEKRKENYSIESDYAKYLLDNKIIECSKKSGIALLSAFILTDGWISRNKRKKLFELGFSNTNRELVQALSDLVFIVFNEVPSNLNLNIKQKMVRYVAPWHQEFINKIRGFCFENRQKTAKNLIKIRNKTILRECIRIAFSCDGFISFEICTERYGYNKKYYSRIRPTLAIGCKSIALRKAWAKISKKIGMNAQIKKDRIKIGSWKSLIKFHNINGFLPNTLIGNDSVYFRGLDKNQVIERLLYIKNRNLQNKQSNLKDSSYLKNIIIYFKDNHENQTPNIGLGLWRPNSKFNS